MKEWKLKKVEKLVASLHDKEEYVILIRNLKQTLNHGLVFKKVHRITKCNQPYINMKIDLGKKAKNGFEKDFF